MGQFGDKNNHNWFVNENAKTKKDLVRFWFDLDMALTEQRRRKKIGHNIFIML